MEQITITVNRLSHSATNVRNTGANAHLDELKASILAHGLLQNLVVTPAEDGKYTVVAGGRRDGRVQRVDVRWGDHGS